MIYMQARGVTDIVDAIVAFKTSLQVRNVTMIDKEEEFANQCDNEATAKDYAIKGTKEEIQALTATVDDAGAKIASLKAKVEDITTKIAETKGELASAISFRAKEHQDSIATEN